MTYQFPDSVLLVFCKAPLAGQVKTRLQPALSAEQAVAAHIDLSKMTLERAVTEALCPVLLYCAPDSEHPFFQQCAAEYPLSLKQQRGSDLGERMHNAFAEALADYRQVVLIGCDCPSLTVDDLRQALTALQNGNEVVIGPASDGGYVLIGLNALQPDLFKNMAWGTNQVLAETRLRIGKTHRHLHELIEQWDVDTIADWERYLAHIKTS